MNAATGGSNTGLPVATTNVFITANTASNFSSMTLGQGFTINSLNFTGTGTSDTAGATITGTLTPLTIEATNANGNTAGSGITVAAGSGANTISAPIILGGTQTWTNSASTLLTVSGGVTNGGFTLTTAGSGTISISAAISGSGGLTDTSTGTVTLSAANTLTGPTLVSNGILNITNATGLSGSSSVTVTSPGLLGFGTNNSESSFLATGVVIQGTGGVISEQGNRNNIVTLNRANTYTGQTTWANDGVVKAGVATVYNGDGTQASGAFGVNSAVVFGTGHVANLALAGFNNQVGSLAGTPASGGGVQLLGATLTIGGDNTSTTFTGPITNNYLLGTDQNGGGTANLVAGGNLIKIGAGTQTFNANGTSTQASSYEGTTTIKGGEAQHQHRHDGQHAVAHPIAGGEEDLPRFAEAQAEHRAGDEARDEGRGSRVDVESHARSKMAGSGCGVGKTGGMRNTRLWKPGTAIAGLVVFKVPPTRRWRADGNSSPGRRHGPFA